VLVLGVVVTAVLAVRGLRVSLSADRSQVVVRNLLRTYRLRWENVSHVGVSFTTSMATQFTAVVFRERDGRDYVPAQATTTIGGRERQRLLAELAELRADLPIQFSE
jgi:hypothetical protein